MSEGRDMRIACAGLDILIRKLKPALRNLGSACVCCLVSEDGYESRSSGPCRISRALHGIRPKASKPLNRIPRPASLVPQRDCLVERLAMGSL